MTPKQKVTFVEPADQLGPNDLISERLVTLSNNNVIKIRATNPYGFWKISYEHGQLPAKLQGQYTEFQYALNDLEKYVQDKELIITDIKRTS